MRYPLAPEQIVRADYYWRLEGDELARSHPFYADIGIDDLLVKLLRRGIEGSLSDDELAELVEPRIERYRQLGNTDVKRGTPEWRTLARGLCVAYYEALERVCERDESNFAGTPSHPMLADVERVEEPPQPLSIEKL